MQATRKGIITVVNNRNDALGHIYSIVVSEARRSINEVAKAGNLFEYYSGIDSVPVLHQSLYYTSIK